MNAAAHKKHRNDFGDELFPDLQELESICRMDVYQMNILSSFFHFRPKAERKLIDGVGTKPE
jgi:hypothetical protein